MREGEFALNKIRQNIDRALTSARLLAKWLVLAGVTGLFCGSVGALFHTAVDTANTLRGQNPWLIYLLPLAGLVIVTVYKLTGTEGLGTNDVIDAVQDGKPVAFLLLPAIFVGTVLTHLCGGSAGREGAALQMGGDIGWHVGRFLRLTDYDRRIATICGMAAFFTALFGTPLAATLFAMMVVNVGLVFYAAFIPSLTASLVAYGITLWLGIPPVRFEVTAPGLDALTALNIAVLGIGCALVTILFCATLRFFHHLLERRFSNVWLRVVMGGVVVAVLSVLLDTDRYNGAGTEIIRQAVEEGSALPQDWIWKILFTAITLAAGYKGGEVVPSFFIGATFGCVLAPLLGVPAGFGAALGLAAVFCGATNCLVPTLVLSVEVFGAQGLLYFAIVCGICYTLSGYTGLYSHQTFLTSKLEAEYRSTIRPHHPPNSV